MVESVAKEKERKLAETLSDLAAAEKRLAEYDRNFRAHTRKRPTQYRNFDIYFDRKPESVFGDWSFVHVDYDGAPDSGDHRNGYAGSVVECKAEIDAQYEDFELDEDGHYTRDGLTLNAGTHE